MKKLTKSQKQLLLLAALFAAIVVVLAVFIFKPPAPVAETFTPKIVDTHIPKDILQQPEYRRLSLPVALPLVPGRTGRENPFEPYH